MSVYVDPLFNCVATRKWPYKQACHLVGDTLDELHGFAKKLGLKSEWFQGHATLEHYDLTENKRQYAVAMGAVEIDMKQMIEKLNKRRKELRLN